MIRIPRLTTALLVIGCGSSPSADDEVDAGAETYDGARGIDDRPLASPPGEPSNLQITQLPNVIGTLAVSWTAAAGATGYVLAYAEGTQAPTTCAAGTTRTTANTQLELSSLLTNRNYAIRVCATNDNPTPDVSGGVVGVAYVHSPLAADVTGLSVAELDPEWVRLAWTTSAEVRIAISAGGTPASTCSTAIESTARERAVLVNLSPATAYQVRICTSNGDSQPLYSEGALLSFVTPARVEPRVNGLGCADPSDPKLTWYGTGPASRYWMTMANVNQATAAQPCAFATASQLVNVTMPQAGAFRAPFGWGQPNERYWVRVCYLNASNVFEQGQQFDLTMPKIIGNQLLPGSCAPAEHLARPMLTMSSTSATVQTQVTLQGTCNVPGTIVRIGGDVASTTTSCGSASTWSTTANITTPIAGPIRIAATLWHDTRFQSAAAFVQVMKQ
jgi:hypothetical protein